LQVVVDQKDIEYNGSLPINKDTKQTMALKYNITRYYKKNFLFADKNRDFPTIFSNKKTDAK
jgi:hypothetical protein